MTYRELTMMDVKELLRRWAAGHSDVDGRADMIELYMNEIVLVTR